MTTTPQEPGGGLSDDDITASGAGSEMPSGDADGTDGDATDTVDGDGTDGGDADGTDGDATDTSDGGGTDGSATRAHRWGCSAVTPRPSSTRSGRPACSCTTVTRPSSS